MKRFLNLNDLGGKMVTVIAILGAGIPAGLYGISLALDAMDLHWQTLRLLMVGSLIIAGALFVILLALIILEQIQDHLLYKQFLRSRGKRIRTDQGLYECPHCGNRNIREFEYFCPICGGELPPST